MNDKKNYKDLTITCKTCGSEFTYTATEQAFFAEKGFGAPIRCHDCRSAKKAKNIERENKEETLKTTKEEVEVIVTMTDPDKDWVQAMNERWKRDLVEFGEKE